MKQLSCHTDNLETEEFGDGLLQISFLWVHFMPSWILEG